MVAVFAEGVFDLLHMNHMRVLHEARALGDRLIVGVTPDDDAASYKRRPILSLAERMETVTALGIADLVVESPPLSEGLTARFLDAHQIGCVVYCSEGWDDHYRVAIERGILKRLPYHDGINTSALIERIRARDDL